MANTLFKKSETPPPPLSEANLSPWKILIVDDEVGVHEVTRLTLMGFEVDGRPIELLSGYSGQEGREIMSQHPDIALAIIDVVMETEYAGLELVRFVREELGNQKTRLVLRTGQPGQAPEHEVVTKYDINDYKEKTELTAQKLKTMCHATIRSYRDIDTIENSRKGIRQVLKSASNVLKSSTLNTFANAVLNQVVSLVQQRTNAIYASSIPANEDERMPQVIAATLDEKDTWSDADFSHLPEKIRKRFEQALNEKSSQKYDDGFVTYLETDHGHQNLLSIDADGPLSNIEIEMLELYCTNVSLTYEMLLKNEEMLDAQRRLVLLLGEAVESRSKETGAHVKRVSLISEKLAKMAGLSLDEVELIKYAAPLHDVGKIAVPDHILHKPGKLEGEEWEIMKSHAAIGAKILQKSKQRVFVIGAEIANYHHERWDGKGYPEGKSGLEIPISARIVAIADVFDALGSKRSYKQPWPNEEIQNFLISNSGSMFDPDLIELFLQDFDGFLSFRDQYPDED